jgi:hypothetical protein
MSNTEQNISKTGHFIITIIAVSILIGGLAFDRYLKDNDLRDTYGDSTDKLHIKMNTWSCDELLIWAYDVGMYTGHNAEWQYAKNLAREKCPNDESWKNPPILTKEPTPTMEELYDKWGKK